jgi:hypothetical protein
MLRQIRFLAQMPGRPGNRPFRDKQPVFAVMSGTGHIAVGYTNDLLNRTSTGLLKKPTVIGQAKTGRATTFKIKNPEACPCPQGDDQRARTDGIERAPRRRSQWKPAIFRHIACATGHHADGETDLLFDISRSPSSRFLLR